MCLAHLLRGSDLLEALTGLNPDQRHNPQDLDQDTEMGKKKIHKGVGDSIARFFEVTGVQKVVKSTVKDCGCKKRQEKLNKLFPYK